MTGSIEIKKLGISEIALAKSLILLFGSDSAAGEEPAFSTGEYIARMLARPDFHVIVALDEGRLIGGLTAYEINMFKRETTEIFLYEIEVAEAHRQKGVGRALIENLKQICLQKGIAEMFVGTSKDNAAARKLYSTTGGEPDEDSVWFNYLFFKKESFPKI